MYMKVHIDGNEKEVAEAWKQVLKAMRHPLAGPGDMSPVAWDSCVI